MKTIRYVGGYDNQLNNQQGLFANSLRTQGITIKRVLYELFVTETYTFVKLCVYIPRQQMYLNKVANDLECE